MQRSIVDMGMKNVHLCLDKQLYDVTIQVFWNQPREFQNTVVHPACMYIIVFFCLHWNLNEMLSLGILCHCSLWRNKRYLQWKSWMKAMRLFQSIAAALLQRFLSIRQNTFDGIEQY